MGCDHRSKSPRARIKVKLHVVRDDRVQSIQQSLI
jgi:hypothetical protein